MGELRTPSSYRPLLILSSSSPSCRLSFTRCPVRDTVLKADTALEGKLPSERRKKMGSTPSRSSRSTRRKTEPTSVMSSTSPCSAPSYSSARSFVSLLLPAPLSRPKARSPSVSITSTLPPLPHLSLLLSPRPCSSALPFPPSPASSRLLSRATPPHPGLPRALAPVFRTSRRRGCTTSSKRGGVRFSPFFSLSRTLLTRGKRRYAAAQVWEFLPPLGNSQAATGGAIYVVRPLLSLCLSSTDSSSA